MLGDGDEAARWRPVRKPYGLDGLRSKLRVNDNLTGKLTIVCPRLPN